MLFNAVSIIEVMPSVRLWIDQTSTLCYLCYIFNDFCLLALQVSHLSSLIKEKDQLIDEKCGTLLKQKEELRQLSQG